VVSAIHGVTLRPDGAPLPEAQVLIHNQNDNSESVVSGPDGAFVDVNLKPGRYTLIASKEGFLTSSAAVQLKAHENFRMALALSARATVSAAAPAQAAAVPAERVVPSAASAQAKAPEAMQERIEQLEAELKREKAKVDATLTASRQPADQHTAATQLPPYASSATPSLPVTPVNAPVPLAPPGPAAPQAQETPATPQAGGQLYPVRRPRLDLAKRQPAQQGRSL
jgi:hypothetical protein